MRGDAPGRAPRRPASGATSRLRGPPSSARTRASPRRTPRRRRAAASDAIAALEAHGEAAMEHLQHLDVPPGLLLHAGQLLEEALAGVGLAPDRRHQAAPAPGRGRAPRRVQGDVVEQSGECPGRQLGRDRVAASSTDRLAIAIELALQPCPQGLGIRRRAWAAQQRRQGQRSAGPAEQRVAPGARGQLQRRGEDHAGRVRPRGTNWVGRRPAARLRADRPPSGRSGRTGRMGRPLPCLSPGSPSIRSPAPASRPRRRRPALPSATGCCQ